MVVILGLDIGNDKCVLAVARDGAVDVLLNDDACREIPSLVHFSQRQRLFGSSARASLTSNPSSTITQLKRLVGLPFHDPRFQHDLPRLPYKTSAASDGGIAVNLHYLGEDREFSSVAMLAMLLSNLRRAAERATGSADFECVLGIPSYFDDRQRRAYLDAAAVAGLRPLRLMHDGVATALGYGVFKERVDESTAVVAFVDVGHCGTQVTVACFGWDGMVVLAHAFDPDLGGRDFDEVIFDHFSRKFEEEHGIVVSSNAKATARLRIACEKAKKVLSANREAHVSIDCLIEDRDANGVITRGEFESMSSKLVGRIGDLFTQALGDAGVRVDRVHSVELVGSGSRIPAISTKLADIYGRVTSRTLNGSECVAVGCAFQCAMLSGHWKTRRYGFVENKKTSAAEFVPYGEIASHGMATKELLDEEKWLTDVDIAYEQINEARNVLEAYIYETRNKLHRRSEFFGNESMRAKVSARLTEVEDWIYEDCKDETKEGYTKTLDELKEEISQLQGTDMVHGFG